MLITYSAMVGCKSVQPHTSCASVEFSYAAVFKWSWNWLVAVNCGWAAVIGDTELIWC
jgi:hypothetical protein